MENKTAIVAGASGLIGNHVVQNLLSGDYYSKVIIITRKKLPVIHPKAELLIADFEKIDEVLSGIKADDVYCCLGTTMKKAGSKEAFKKVDMDYVLGLAKIMKQNGAKQFLLVSSMGAGINSAFFYSRVKGETEEELKKMGFEKLQIFRPSLLLGHREESRTGEDLAKSIYKITSFLYAGPLKKYKAIEGSKVAQGMVKIATGDFRGVNIFESDTISSL